MSKAMVVDDSYKLFNDDGVDSPKLGDTVAISSSTPASCGTCCRASSSKKTPRQSHLRSLQQMYAA